MPEIYEWWVVSDWMGEKLLQVGQPVLRNDLGTWWGRTCTGQSYTLDGSINRIARWLAGEDTL